MGKERKLMKGNEAIAEAAMRAGCTAYFGYPITPQNELTAYMAKNMLERKRTFIQAESEVAAISMVFGATAAGARSMTSSSSPGLSLKQEGISYAAGADLPIVVVNVQRSGPGLGGISPSQEDYFQTTRGGGHGDYYNIVLAPKSVQEAADLTWEAFDLADKYRVPVIVLADGMIGQMMEAVILPDERKLESLPDRSSYCVGGQYRTHRDPHIVTSLDLVPETLEKSILARFKKYDVIKAAETRFEATDTEDAELVMVAYGTSARVCHGALDLAKAEGIKLGLFRPITLWPFPGEAIAKLAKAGKKILDVEMSMGQMIEDVRLAVDGKAKVEFYGRTGGMIPTEEEVFAYAKKLLGKQGR